MAKSSAIDVGAIVELILRIVVAAIPLIEILTARFAGLSSKEKQDSVVAAVRAGLAPSWPIGGNGLAENPRVDTAVRGVIDAVVKLHKAVATAHARNGA